MIDINTITINSFQLLICFTIVTILIYYYILFNGGIPKNQTINIMICINIATIITLIAVCCYFQYIENQIEDEKKANNIAQLFIDSNSTNCSDTNIQYHIDLKKLNISFKERYKNN